MTFIIVAVRPGQINQPDTVQDDMSVNNPTNRVTASDLADDKRGLDVLPAFLNADGEGTLVSSSTPFPVVPADATKTNALILCALESILRELQAINFHLETITETASQR